MNMQEAHNRFKKIEPILTIFVWPWMLQISTRVFFDRDIPYVLCFIAEFTLFGFFRIIGAGLGIVNRPVIVNQIPGPPGPMGPMGPAGKDSEVKNDSTSA